MAKASRFASPDFAAIVGTAGKDILASMKATEIIHQHNGLSGELREDGLRAFLAKLLPTRYHVGTGLAFDARSQQSRQLDVMISLDSPFTSLLPSGKQLVVPCERLLAAIEVKTRLTSSELRKAINNASSVRSLRPFGTDEFVGARSGGSASSHREHRVFYSLVAYDTDLVEGEAWLSREWSRFAELVDTEGADPTIIDRIVVLNRGLINCPHGRGRISEQGMDEVTGEWFVHVLNHLEREGRRRPPLDIDVYTSTKRWTNLNRHASRPVRDRRDENGAAKPTTVKAPRPSTPVTTSPNRRQPPKSR